MTVNKNHRSALTSSLKHVKNNTSHKDVGQYKQHPVNRFTYHFIATITQQAPQAEPFPWGSYFDHALAWEKRIDDPTVMIVTYEELKQVLTHTL
ncbi:hypothetical protein INR49_009464 [Caranx melampygus]|nr:hypothetical protein INR49_009464 [Caranx melampygus]